MITNFAEFLQKKEGVHLTMCSLTIHRIDQLVNEYIEQLFTVDPRRQEKNIKWKDVKVSRPIAHNAHLTKESKLLLVLSRSGNLFKAYYNTETGIFHLQGAPDTQVAVEWWVEFENPWPDKVKQIADSLKQLDEEALFSRRRVGGVFPDNQANPHLGNDTVYRPKFIKQIDAEVDVETVSPAEWLISVEKKFKEIQQRGDRPLREGDSVNIMFDGSKIGEATITEMLGTGEISKVDVKVCPPVAAKSIKVELGPVDWQEGNTTEPSKFEKAIEQTYKDEVYKTAQRMGGIVLEMNGKEYVAKVKRNTIVIDNDYKQYQITADTIADIEQWVRKQSESVMPQDYKRMLKCANFIDGADGKFEFIYGCWVSEYGQEADSSYIVLNFDEMK